MLRRKLLLMLGPLVAVLVVVAIVAIVLLQGVLHGMDHISTEALAVVDKVNRLAGTITTVEAELYDLQLARKRRLDDLIVAVECVRAQVAELGEHDIVASEEGRRPFDRLDAKLPEFERYVSTIATTRNPKLAMRQNDEALTLTVAMRRDILELGSLVQAHARQEQKAVTAHFRWVVLGLTFIFLVLINLAVLALLRAARLVLDPVDKLVAASRQLAQQHFEQRVELSRNDEFGELARSYNDMAEQLQADEHRRIETLGQVAATLNHELNNAMAIIDLQLRLLGRQASGDERLDRRLHEIQAALARMAETVARLRQVRRIVLTDYVDGTKMLDLEQSVGEDECGEHPGPPVGRPSASRASAATVGRAATDHAEKN